MPSKNTISFDLPGFEVDWVDSYGDLLVIRAHSTALEAICPNCHQSSSRVHSHYTREPRDLPSSGRKVRLVLRVRRFRCQNVGCKRKTFAERIPHVAPVHGQRTIRLSLTLQAIALELEFRQAEKSLDKNPGQKSTLTTEFRWVNQAFVARVGPRLSTLKR